MVPYWSFQGLPRSGLCDEAEPFDPTGLPPEQRVLEGVGVYLSRREMDDRTHRITLRQGNGLTLVKRNVAGSG